MPAAIQGNNKTWGPYRMQVWQYGVEQSSFKDVVESGEEFSVTWFYDPNPAERLAGATARQYQEQTFAAGTFYIRVVGQMFNLRQTALNLGIFNSYTELAAFLGNL